MDINNLNIIHDTANCWELPLPWWVTPEPVLWEEKNITFKYITNWDKKDALPFKSHERLDILEDLKPEISRFHVKKPKKIINGDETILITDSPNVEILKPNYSKKNDNSKKNYLAIYIQKIDLYWPLFLYLIIICIGVVLVVKFPTPASTLFNAKHNDAVADERQESQKILIKFNKTKKLWTYFKNIYKKIFKTK